MSSGQKTSKKICLWEMQQAVRLDPNKYAGAFTAYQNYHTTLAADRRKSAPIALGKDGANGFEQQIAIKLEESQLISWVGD
jgi:hypothetical protein